MPTQLQIEQFRKKARSLGATEAQISAEIARKTQEEARSTARQSTSLTQKTPTPTAPVSQPQQGLVRKVAGAIAKPAINAGKFVMEASGQASRAIQDPNISFANPLVRNQKFKVDEFDDEIDQLFTQNRGIIAQARQEQDKKKKDQLLKQSREISKRIEELGNKAGSVGAQKKSFLEDDKNLDGRGKILETGARRTAGAMSYVVPGGSGVKGAVIAGAGAGGLSAFSEDGSTVEDVATGALTGGAISGATALGLKALRSEASKKVGQFLKNRGEDIQLSTYTKNLGKPTKVEGGRDLLVRMRRVGIKAGDADNVVEQANNILKEDGGLVYQATQELNKKGVKIPVSKLTEKLRNEISSAKSSVTRKPLEQVLETIETDLAGKDFITPDELYLLKTEYGGLGRWTSLSSTVEKSQAEAWRKIYQESNQIIDSTLRKNGFKEFRTINERLHTAMQASQYASRSGNVAPNKYNVGLYDWLSVIAGGNLVTGVGMVIGKRAVESGKFAEVGSGLLSSVGENLRKIRPSNIQIPQTAVNASIVGATQSFPSGINDDSNDSSYEDTTEDLPNQEDLQNIDEIVPQDDISTQRSKTPTKQEFLREMIKRGATSQDIPQLIQMYDQLIPQEDPDALSDQFLETGEPQTRADRMWMLENPDKIPGKTKEVDMTEGERKLKNAGTSAQKALDLLESGEVKTGLGQKTLGKVGEKLGTNSQAQQRYRSSLALARTTARNALLGANMTETEMESIQAFIPEFDDAPEIAKEKLKTFIELMNEFSGVIVDAPEKLTK